MECSVSYSELLSLSIIRVRRLFIVPAGRVRPRMRQLWATQAMCADRIITTRLWDHGWHNSPLLRNATMHKHGAALIVFRVFHFECQRAPTCHVITPVIDIVTVTTQCVPCCQNVW